VKQKEGRDWLDLSRCIFVPEEDLDDEGFEFRFSDAGASLYLTREDMERVIKFVAARGIEGKTRYRKGRK
jgi:hypothetical protein